MSSIILLMLSLDGKTAQALSPRSFLQRTNVAVAPQKVKPIDFNKFPKYAFTEKAPENYRQVDISYEIDENKTPTLIVQLVLEGNATPLLPLGASIKTISSNPNTVTIRIPLSVKPKPALVLQKLAHSSRKILAKFIRDEYIINFPDQATLDNFSTTVFPLSEIGISTSDLDRKSVDLVLNTGVIGKLRPSSTSKISFLKKVKQTKPSFSEKKLSQWNMMKDLLMAGAIADSIGAAVEFNLAEQSTQYLQEHWDKNKRLDYDLALLVNKKPDALNFYHASAHAHVNSATDDTDQALLVIDALDRSKGDLTQAPKLLAKGIDDWWNTQSSHLFGRKNPFGLGELTFKTINGDGFFQNPYTVAKKIWQDYDNSKFKIIEGTEARRSSVLREENSANGALMRTAPVIVNATSHNDAIEKADAMAKVTHYDPSARAYVTFYISLLYQIFQNNSSGRDLTEQQLEKLISNAKQITLVKLKNYIADAYDNENMTTQTAIYNHYADQLTHQVLQTGKTDVSWKDLKLDDVPIGTSCKALSSVVFALREAVQAKKNNKNLSNIFQVILANLFAQGGDSDTNGSVVGPMLYAALGVDSIPPHLKQGLRYEDSQIYTNVVQKTFQEKTDMDLLSKSKKSGISDTSQPIRRTKRNTNMKPTWNTPQPIAKVNIPQPIARGNTTQPIARGNTTQPTAKVNIPQPIARGNTPQTLLPGTTLFVEGTLKTNKEDRFSNQRVLVITVPKTSLTNQTQFLEECREISQKCEGKNALPGNAYTEKYPFPWFQFSQTATTYTFKIQSYKGLGNINPQQNNLFAVNFPENKLPFKRTFLKTLGLHSIGQNYTYKDKKDSQGNKQEKGAFYLFPQFNSSITQEGKINLLASPVANPPATPPATPFAEPSHNQNNPFQENNKLLFKTPMAEASYKIVKSDDDSDWLAITLTPQNKIEWSQFALNYFDSTPNIEHLIESDKKEGKISIKIRTITEGGLILLDLPANNTNRENFLLQLYQETTLGKILFDCKSACIYDIFLAEKSERNQLFTSDTHQIVLSDQFRNKKWDIPIDLHNMQETATPKTLKGWLSFLDLVKSTSLYSIKLELNNHSTITYDGDHTSFIHNTFPRLTSIKIQNRTPQKWYRNWNKMSRVSA